VHTLALVYAYSFMHENSLLTVILPKKEVTSWTDIPNPGYEIRRGGSLGADNETAFSEISFTYDEKPFKFCYVYNYVDINRNPTIFFFISSVYDTNQSSNYTCELTDPERGVLNEVYYGYFENGGPAIMIVSPTDVRDMDSIREFLIETMQFYEKYKGYWWVYSYPNFQSIRTNYFDIEVVSIERRED